ncbi:MAG TPA: DUF885 domain-containing protein [Terriglobales bacterium]|nr:DUF885 domain-containing protein [Terriglobales bacterium]
MGKRVRSFQFLNSFIIVSLLMSANLFGQNPAPAASTPAFDAQYDRLVDEYFDAYFNLHPTEGTSAGFHQYDAQLEDFSRPGLDREVAFLRSFQQKFAGIHPPSRPLAAADLELLRSSIAGQLLDLENIRMWEKDPDQYSSFVSASAFTIMSRNYASQEQRLRSLVARERQMPAVFAAARHNLRNPPRVYTEVALEQMPGIIGFFRKDVPAAFSKVKDAKLLSDFHSANQAVVAALENYQNYLKEDLLPVSQGDFRIGAENYRKKLLDDEMVDLPIERLLEIGFADLHRNQQALKATAAKIDAQRTPQQILDGLQKDHPAPGQLLEAFRSVLGGLKSYIIAHHIVTIPSPVLPIVEETPPFARALTFASMDTPGAYENKAKEAYFNVTLPEASWPRERVQEFMAGFNRGTIISTAVHEVYPGHYTQFLWVQAAPSKVRKLIYSNSNAEGWAHYCEQMMLDEGYGRTPGVPLDKDTAFLQLRLGQLQDALLRDARYIVGIEMHTGKMTFDQGVDFFVKEGYQTRAVAEVETKRGTSDPTYLVYTLGKLEIMKLRDDYKKMKGSSFNLQEFHDQFMKQGGVPVKLIRKTMLGNDSPVL